MEVEKIFCRKELKRTVYLKLEFWITVSQDTEREFLVSIILINEEATQA